MKSTKEKIQERQLELSRHIHIMMCDILTKKVYETRVKSRRKMGTPKRTWKQLQKEICFKIGRDQIGSSKL